MCDCESARPRSTTVGTKSFCSWLAGSFSYRGFFSGEGLSFGTCDDMKALKFSDMDQADFFRAATLGVLALAFLIAVLSSIF